MGNEGLSNENEGNVTNVEGQGVLDEKTSIIVSTPLADNLRRNGQIQIKKLIEDKSIKLIKKKEESLSNGDINEVDIDRILSKENIDFYNLKKNDYLSKYPQLAEDPFDMDDLHLMIMEQIFQRELRFSKKKTASKDISKEYEASVKRQLELKKSLSMRRSDRVNSKNNEKKILNISSLSMNFNNSDHVSALHDRLNLLQQEEDELEHNSEEEILE